MVVELRKGSADLVALAIIVTAVVVSGAFIFSGGLPVSKPTSGADFFSETPTGELRKFANAAEIEDFLALGQGAGTSRTGYDGGLVKASASSAEDSSGLSAPSAGAQGDGYSTTNVQYAGVDEADFVKNDGRYIYVVSGQSILIIDSNSGEMQKASEIKIPSKNSWGEAPKEIFVKDDRLFVVAEGNEAGYYFQKYDILPQQYNRQFTRIFVYDTADKANPVLLRNLTVSGNYFQSRLIEGYVFLVTNEYPSYSRVYPPVLFAGGLKVSPEVYYFDNPEENHQFSTVASVSINSGELAQAKSFLIGYANTLMVSENSIYIAYQKSRPCSWRFWSCYSSQGNYERERFFEVVLPLLGGQVRQRIDGIVSQGLAEDEEWEQISAVLSDFYTGLSEKGALSSEDSALLEKIEAALQEYDLRKELEETQTVIHKIAIGKADGSIEYSSKGEVPGSLLNQFSLDDSEGKLRVATTFSGWFSSGSVQFNNVYLLDQGMRTTGKLENISAGERIYSTRFIGDRLYMVTFRQTDPLFVIDLSGENPAILGELHIPGFSNYLHPYKGDYLIGVGRETKENENGGTVIQGVKIALFDVSDVSNPQQVDKFEIGTRESDSAALYDHKAFLLSEAKGILSIPISETEYVELLPEETIPGKVYYPRYKYRIWTGAYVLNVSESGFGLAGTVEHSSFENSYFYWNSQSTVTRSLYIGDILYTVSEKYLKANALPGLEATGSITISPEIEKGIGYPEPLIAE
ncbi:MAG: beta-propeller domain-containing protein [archaeon]